MIIISEENVKIRPKYSNKRKTTEEYKKELKIKNPNIEVLEEYINSNTKIKHKCIVCEHEWDVVPDQLLRGHGCPNCAKKIIGVKSSLNNSKTHEQYVKDVNKINSNIEVVGTYINSHIKILHKCKIDNNEWYAMPSNILKGRNCPICAEKHRVLLRRKNQDEYIRQVSDFTDKIEVRYIY